MAMVILYKPNGETKEYPHVSNARYISETKISFTNDDTNETIDTNLPFVIISKKRSF